MSEHEFVVDPDDPDSYDRMAAEVCATGRLAGVVDCWAAATPDSTDVNTAGYVQFLGVLQLGHALGPRTTVRPLPIVLAARGTDRLLDDDVLDPPRAFSVGAARVLPQEHPGFRLTHVDVDDHATVPDLLVAELTATAPEPDVALRDGERFLLTYRQSPIPETDESNEIPERPVVMVTGGLGHMGITLGEALFASFGARLVLVGRSSFPDPEQWLERSVDPSFDDHEREILRRLAAMRAVRDDVLVLTADLRDEAQVRAAVDAGVRAVRRDRRDDPRRRQRQPGRVRSGRRHRTVGHRQPDLAEAVRTWTSSSRRCAGASRRRWVLHSSISSVLGGLGLSAYAGANAVLDSIATRGGPTWLSIGWDAWDNAAEAQMAGMPTAIRPEEGQEAFLRAAAGAARVPRRHRGRRPRRPARVVGPSFRSGEAHRGRRPASPAQPRPPYVEPGSDTETTLADIWASQLGLDKVGVHDRFFDLGGHSLLAVQVASEIRDRFQIEMPVLQLFKAPTIRELAELIEQAELTGGVVDTAETAGSSVTADAVAVPIGPIESPGDLAKAGYREFYDDVSRRLAATGMGEASFFLNYGYVSRGKGDEAAVDVPEEVPNRNSIRLALELVGATVLAGRDALDVGCGRGGTAALLAEQFGAVAAGVDLSPEAIAFCRNAHRAPGLRFEVGDAENLPFDDASFDVVTNLESSHTYPDMRAFLGEVRRVLRPAGTTGIPMRLILLAAEHAGRRTSGRRATCPVPARGPYLHGLRGCGGRRRGHEDRPPLPHLPSLRSRGGRRLGRGLPGT